MNIFEYEGKEFDKKLDEIFKNINKEDLKKELIECGLEIKKPIVEEQVYKLKQEPIITEQKYKSIKELTALQQQYKSIQNQIIPERQYKFIQGHELFNYFNMFDIHTDKTSNSLIDNVLKRKTKIGDVA